MKKLLAFTLILVLCLSVVLVACNDKDDNGTKTLPAPAEHLEEARNAVEKTYNTERVSEETDVDYVLSKAVPLNGIYSYPITWTVSDSRITVDNHSDTEVLINVPDESPVEIKYTLTATITADDGTTAKVDFQHTVPEFKLYDYAGYVAAKDDVKINIDGIVTAILPKDNGASNSGLYMNTVDKDGFSPLFYAVLGNPKKYFDSVIQIRSALKEDNDEKLYSALENSPCVKGNLAALKILIQNGANVQLTDRNKNSAFLYASLFCNNSEILKELIKGGADSNELLYKEPMLTYAAFTNDNPECVRYLADLGKNVDYANSHGTTPIMWAAMYNKNPAVIDALISAGADINDTRHENGYTPLHWAVRCNRNPAMAEHIIKLGADINKEDKYGSTPLLWAVCNSNPKDVLKKIENAFDNISTTSFNAARYFEKIRQKGKPEIVPVLLKNNPSAGSLKDAYLLAYCLSSAKVANMILEKIENSKSTYDDDYLFWLCLSQDDEKINTLKKILLKPENKFSYDSSKLFFWAFYLKNSKALQVFTDDFRISSDYEIVKAAIAISTQKEYLEPVIKSCKNVNKQTLYGETLLHYAVNQDNSEAVKSLIRNGAKIDMRYGSDYRTELLAAVNKSYPNAEIVRALINAGADVNARDKDGATVLIYAVNKNYTPNVANILISAWQK